MSSSSVSGDISSNPAMESRIGDKNDDVFGHARIRRDSSSSPEIQLYTAETCPGIRRTGTTPDIPWWVTFGEGDFGCEAEAWLWMCENGLVATEATKERLREDVAEWKATQSQAASRGQDVSDIVEDMESLAIPIEDHDDEDTVQCKSDYNEVLKANSDLHVIHRAKVASDEDVAAVWNLTSDVKIDVAECSTSQNKDDESGIETTAAVFHDHNYISHYDPTMVEPEKEKQKR